MKLGHQSGAIALVVIGAIGYSSKAIFIKLAYQYGVDSVSLVALRMAFALPFFVLAAVYDRRQRKEQVPPLNSQQWLAVAGLGIVGYYLASLFDFWSLQYLTASLGRLILFTYPTLVLFLSALLLGRRIRWVELVAVLITYIGVTLAFSQSVELQQGRSFWWGAALSFASALAYAIYLIGSGEYLPKLGTLRFTSITMSVACVAILLHHAVQYQWALFHFPRPVYGYALGMALLATVFPALLIAEGIRRIGAAPAAIASSIGPISTILLAAIFLGEAFGGWQWLGAVLVIAGVWVLGRGKL